MVSEQAQPLFHTKDVHSLPRHLSLQHRRKETAPPSHEPQVSTKQPKTITAGGALPQQPPGSAWQSLPGRLPSDELPFPQGAPGSTALVWAALSRLQFPCK